jgi:hypothetical protein
LLSALRRSPDLENDMSDFYQHKQVGATMLIACTTIAAFIGIAIGTRGAVWPVLGAIAILALVAWIFSSLTVAVDTGELSWYFGPGLWRYRIARNTIQSVAIVQNHWWNGFGIRMRAGWRLYNVSGFNAVEVHLQSGEIVRLGTDDPRGLVAALKS